jgi:hypothetical protein
VATWKQMQAQLAKLSIACAKASAARAEMRTTSRTTRPLRQEARKVPAPVLDAVDRLIALSTEVGK